MKSIILGLLTLLGFSLTAQAHDSYVSFSTSTYSVNENVAGGKLRIVVKRTGYFLIDAAVDYTLSSGTATPGLDYGVSTGTLLWGISDSPTKYFDIQILDDALVESTETFKLTLINPRTPSTPGATWTKLVAPTSAIVSIKDNDQVVIIPNAAPAVNAGADKNLPSPQQTTLSGAATDDGQPTPANLQTTWSFISGPVTIVFDSTTSLTTTATFPQAGTYVIRLTGSDGSLSSFDELTVVVLTPATPNTAPLTNAGMDQNLSLPQQMTLSGTVTDDGLPLPANLQVIWNVVSGPSGVTFTSSTSAQTLVEFVQPGTYVLELTGSDGVLSSSDTITVVVGAPASQTNIDDFKNIFNPDKESLNIPITLGNAMHVKFVVYDHFGDEIDTLINGDLSAGSHIISWDGQNFRNTGAGSGIYMILIEMDGQISKKKIILRR